MKSIKIGITFSGGGTRAMAHVGVLKALEEAGIESDIYAGASGGSIVGALYAAGLSIDEILEFAGAGSLYKAFTFRLPNRGLTDLSYLRKMLQKYLPDNHFSALKKPLYIVATNLQTGRLVVFNEGELIQPILASCAFPFVFHPVEINGEYYLDGGIYDNMPVKPIKDKCDYLIGINVMPRVEVTRESLDSLRAIATRSFELSVYNNTQYNFDACDKVIEVNDTFKYSIFNFGKMRDMFEMGYETGKVAAKEILSDLIKLQMENEHQAL